MFDYVFELISEIRLSNDYFEFTNKITIKHRPQSAMLLKGFQFNIVFNNQTRVFTISFRKCFKTFMILKASF